MKRILSGIFGCLLASGVAIASSTDFVKVKTISPYEVNEKGLLAANFTDLSPKAIEMGLREAELVASSKIDPKSNIMTLTWHSISKTVKGTRLSENLDEPLSSRIKLSNSHQIIQAQQSLTASGSVESIIDAYNRLLKKAEEDVEVDASSSTLETNSENDFGQKDNNSGGGYLSGDNQDGIENGEIPDVDVGTDEIVESVEKCNLKVDIEAGLVSEQERVIKTSSNTGQVVEVGDCKNSGQSYPIMKDWEAGCSVQLDQSTGEYKKGYKLYAMIEGSRYSISECQWDNTGINYNVEYDTKSCSLENAVVRIEQGEYLVPYKEYTVIDGQRYDLSECKTDESQKKDLPTETQSCANRHDFATETTYEQNKILTLDPMGKNTLKTGACNDTGKQYPLEKNFDLNICSDLPNFIEGKYYQGFRYFYQKDGAEISAGDCLVDMDNPLDMETEISTCKATENLIDRQATINKKWFITDPNSGKKEYVSDCMETDEVYPIVTTTNTCQPQLISDLNKVLLTERDGWMDAENTWHYVSECRPSETELDIKKEFCSNPEFEHDYVGGQSYYRSRDYYEHDGGKVYINDCSRDTSTSFPHIKATDNCPAKHDDANLRSQVFSKTLIEVNGQRQEIRGCEADTGFIPYSYQSRKSSAAEIYGIPVRLSWTASAPMNEFGAVLTQAFNNNSWRSGWGGNMQRFKNEITGKGAKWTGTAMYHYPDGANTLFSTRADCQPFANGDSFSSAPFTWQQTIYRRYDSSLYTSPIEFTIRQHVQNCDTMIYIYK